MRHNDKIITNQWTDCAYGENVRVSAILTRSSSIEGIEINRFSSESGGKLRLASRNGHIFSLLAGTASLTTKLQSRALKITAGAHVYIPPGFEASIEFSTAATAIHAAADSENSRGEELLIHHEKFLRPARFVLTPQYLSRRAFLHRDSTLLSKSGDPIAWFHTTMFDTRGLPENSEGLEVFKMSYDHQSEINVVYDVQGAAKVRFAHHPYTSSKQQTWSEWSLIDNETTYYLNESSNGESIERIFDSDGGQERCFRNRHEVFIEPAAHVSLCCLFDPGPTGHESHQPGEYSSYGPVSETLQSEQYIQFLKDTSALDNMIRSLSMQSAQDDRSPLDNSPHWPAYEAAMEKAIQTEADMISGAGAGRKTIVEPWRLRG